MSIITARTAIAAVAAGLLAGCATAPATTATRLECPAATLVARITTQGTELAALSPPPVPDKAARMEQNGQATLSCRPVGGRLKACRVMFEAPTKMGFAKTALTHSSQVIYPAADRDEPVVVTFRYDLVQTSNGTACS